VLLCSLIDGYQPKQEPAASIFRVNYLPNYMASHPIGQQSSVTSATPQIPDTECITQQQQKIGGINIYMQMNVKLQMCNSLSEHLCHFTDYEILISTFYATKFCRYLSDII